MSTNMRPLEFRNYLPEIFRSDEVQGQNFLSRFLKPFELLFEDLEVEIEGTPGGAGGIPDLFDVDAAPPEQFKQNSSAEVEFLNYLASWIAVPLRPEKTLNWNRQFLKTAIRWQPQRGTLAGLEAMLRAWLKGDLLETNPPLLILSDLTSNAPDSDAVFQLGVTATLGVDTALGEGPPSFFVCDLVVDPRIGESDSAIATVIERAARILLDAEKPAHTHYKLTVRLPLGE